MTTRVLAFALIGSLCAAIAPAMAQNWSGDARHIAMGGVGTRSNLASGMIEEEKGYRTIVIPFGLFQVLKDIDIFDPGSDEFDLVRSIEYAASPLHYTFDRDGTGTGAAFVYAIRNGELSRDLNVYRGFVPMNQPVAYGLANPSFGGTIPFYRSDRTRHGVYIGAGPYLALRGGIEIDDQLTGLLASETDVYLMNAHLPLSTDVRGEVALAITGGYRGRFPLGDIGGGPDDRQGLYVALNYSHLRGFRYEDADVAVRLDTDDEGLLTVDPLLPPPVLLARQTSESGRGFAIDLGVAALVDRWELGFGINSLANRIEWTGVEAIDYTLDDPFTGGGFAEGAPAPIGDVTVKQPVEYVGNVGYHADRWTAIAELTERTTDDPDDVNRFDGRKFRTGFEYRFLVLEPRAGAYYTRGRWNPTAGVGVNLGGFGIDGAVYWTDTNVQRERHATYALSLRIGRRPL